jgi:hypothetical protein
MSDGEDIGPWMTGRFAELLVSTMQPWLRLTGGLEERLRTAAVRAGDALLGDGWVARRSHHAAYTLRGRARRATIQVDLWMLA